MDAHESVSTLGFNMIHCSDPFDLMNLITCPIDDGLGFQLQSVSECVCVCVWDLEEAVGGDAELLTTVFPPGSGLLVVQAVFLLSALRRESSRHL